MQKIARKYHRKTVAERRKSNERQQYERSRRGGLAGRTTDGRTDGKPELRELKKLLCCMMSKAHEDEEEMIRGMESCSAAVVMATIRTVAAAAAVHASSQATSLLDSCLPTSDI